MNGNQLLFYNSTIDIYWHGAIIGLAIFVACALMWLLLKAIRPGAVTVMKYIILFSFPFGLVAARLEYCYFRKDEFQGGLPEILDMSSGGFGLFGAIAVAVIVILAVGKLGKRYTLAELFDAAGVAGAAGIAIGRMASHFSGEEQGFELETSFFQRFMFSKYSASEDKWYVTVYTYEAIAAALIFIVTAWAFYAVYKRNKYKRGTVALLFWFYYSISQILFESWRSDSLFLNTLGFVRVNQVICAVIMVVILAIYCVKYTKRYGYTQIQILVWFELLLFLALAFTCEFTMTGGTHLRNYIGMIVGLLGMLITGDRIIRRARLSPKKRKA